jgi:transcriptional regulator with XRE-family HTH domain
MEKAEVLEFYKVVGKNIKNVRREKELKAFDIANRLGMSESAYTKIERGETKIGLDKIQELSAIFEIPFENLLVQHLADNYHFANSPNSSGRVHTLNNNISADLLHELVGQLKEKDK